MNANESLIASGISCLIAMVVYAAAAAAILAVMIFVGVTVLRALGVIN